MYINAVFGLYLDKKPTSSRMVPLTLFELTKAKQSSMARLENNKAT